MTTCQRFEEEGLLQLEQGVPLDAHFGSCPDCQAARASYERLTHDIGALERLEPPDGWQQRVWERVGDSKPTTSLSEGKLVRADFVHRPRQRWVWAAGFGMAAAVFVAILLPRLQQPGSPTLQTEVHAGTGPTRRGAFVPGSPVVLGNVLQLSATAPGARYVELRVYRNADQLILQTSRVGDAAADEILRAAFLLDAVGNYQPALFISDEPIPPPSGSPDADYAAARTAGAEIILGSPISVR